MVNRDFLFKIMTGVSYEDKPPWQFRYYSRAIEILRAMMIKKDEAKIRKMQEDYKKQSLVMNAQAKAKKEREIHYAENSFRCPYYQSPEANKPIGRVF